MVKMRKLPLLALVGLCTMFSSLSAQSLAAPNLFAQVAERYAALYDYSATIAISTEDSANPGKMVNMSGKMFWKARSRLRIDFTSPRDQVLVSNGEVLQVYLPAYNVTLTQKLDTSSSTNPGGLATKEGLSMMRRGYNIAYKTGPELTPIDDSRGEMVYRLLLTWKNSSQGFRQLELAITESMYIRRIDGITADQRKVRIEFTGLGLNQGIPDNKFDYTAPPEANQYDSFLFGNNN